MAGRKLLSIPVFAGPHSTGEIVSFWGGRGREKIFYINGSGHLDKKKWVNILEPVRIYSNILKCYNNFGVVRSGNPPEQNSLIL
jgi:hypothetical protein